MNHIHKFIIFIILSAATAFLIFKPAAFPMCDCCRRIKPRFCFKFLSAQDMRLSRKGDIAVCKSCCQEHNIHSLSEYKRRSEIRKRAEYKSKYL